MAQSTASSGMAIAIAMAAVPAQGAERDACALVQSAPAGALLNIPFRIVDGRIYVEARVDGEGPFTFAVDSGASGMARADARLVKRLGLPTHGSSQTSDGVATARVDTVHLASVEIGGFERRNLETITRDYSGRMDDAAAIDGILGRDFFADGLLVVDYPARRLTFTRVQGLSHPAPGVLAYERAFRVPATIGGAVAEANLDTGANVTFVLPKTLFDMVNGGPVAEAGAGRLTNTTVDAGRANVAGPFRIGAAEWNDVDVRVSEAYPELLAGARALQQFALLIDQRTQAIALCPPDAP